ncbi:hypothetical protein FF100_31590 [Methylobacterium terricola]|uniref:Uncharacterized protein n=1 Tax=Methylobacterium terricola TaxID=2583531 RepID=A0A5C4L755_9HYPH|nr:hypothetical protein [Methylobacterium terricola]TNC07627.1 hypothetical protein FF100_31590 [Methylobacterium terricola]
MAQAFCESSDCVNALAPLEYLPADTAVQLTRMYLACSHLDHDRGNNEPANLKALCQRWFTYR